MPLEHLYFGELGHHILRGWEQLEDGKFHVVETLVAKFRHDSGDNAVGRLIGPNGMTVKWVRRMHPGIDIIADTNAIKFLHAEAKITVEATKDSLVEAKNMVTAALQDVLPLLNEQDPRNRTVADFQRFCKDDIVDGLEVEWRLSNFRSVPLLNGSMAAYRNPASWYQAGLGNQFTVPTETFPASLPGFQVGEPLPPPQLIPVPHPPQGYGFLMAAPNQAFVPSFRAPMMQNTYAVAVRQYRSSYRTDRMNRGRRF